MRCESCGGPGSGNFCGTCGTAMSARRAGPRWWRLAGVMAAAFLLGVALPAAFILGTGINPTVAGTGLSGPTSSVTTTVTATATATITAIVPHTINETVTETVTAQPPSAAPPETQRPRGTLLVQAGPEGGFGQTFPRGKCAVWQTGFVNQSNTAIDQITVAPPGGEYTKYEWNGHDYPTRAATRPAPAVLNVYMAPGQHAAFKYQTCTSTPSPGPKFEYGALSPDYVTFRWEGGVTGRACFKC